jgi:hypothetical protein
MARKGKNKRKQKKYSKKQFVEIVCSACNICENVGNPIFCYNSIYKLNPKRFPTVLKNLLNLRSHFEDLNLPASDLGIDQFAETFCNTGICGNMFTGFCPLLPDCHDIFISQVDDEHKPISLKHKITKFKQKSKINSKKRRYICHAYPTFFSSNNKKFKDTVERILNEDNVIKQNSNKKSTKEVKELSHSVAEDKKS